LLRNTYKQQWPTLNDFPITAENTSVFADKKVCVEEEVKKRNRITAQWKDNK
jgi:hypothetical protein